MIYVVAHKMFTPPDLDESYRTIFVGDRVRAKAKKDGFLVDSNGDSISDKNPYYCELTALYWISYRPDRYQKIKEFYLSSIQLCEKKNYSNEIKVRLIGPYLSFTIAALKQESSRKPIGNEQIREIINDKVFYELICKKYKQNFMRRIFIWAAKKKM